MKNFKGFIAGMLAMLMIISVAGTVFAAPVRRTVNALFGSIQIAVDGERVAPENITDANGNIVELFSIEGTVYIPIRAFAGIIGYEVSWDGETDTVLLNKLPAPIKIILNISSKVYHTSELCMGVMRMNDENREDKIIYDIEELADIIEGYTPCGICAG